MSSLSDADRQSLCMAIAGEGCFTVIGGGVAFQLKVRKDDLAWIVALRDMTGGMGTIIFEKPNAGSCRLENARPCAKWCIYSQAQRETLVEMLDGADWHGAKKKKDFMIFAAIVRETAKEPHLRNKDYMRALYDQIRLVKQYDVDDLPYLDVPDDQLSFEWDDDPLP